MERAPQLRQSDMDWLPDFLTPNNKLFGIEWTAWKVVGWIGNAVFFSRFFVQWFATERKKQVVVPTSFWWLSLVGSLILLAYGIRQGDSVFIFAYAFTWIPYIRNLMIHHRSRRAQQLCAQCDIRHPPSAVYCSICGVKLDGGNAGAGEKSSAKSL